MVKGSENDMNETLEKRRALPKRSESLDLTEGVIWKKFLQFFFPILIGLLVQQLYNTADTLIVGWFVGTDGLAAVGGSACQVINVFIGFFTGLGSGATVVVSQRFGAKDDVQLSRTVHTIITFFTAVGAVLTAAGMLLARPMLMLAKNPAEIMDMSTSYLAVYFAGTVSVLLFNVGSGVLRAVGDSKRPLYYLVICCVLNIGLDLLFVGGFGLGVAGAAWATVIAQTVSAMLVIVTMMRTNEAYRLDLKKLGIDRRALRDTLNIGIPSGIQSSMYNVSNFIVQIGVNELGVAVIAAWSAVGKIDGVFWVMSNSFGAAICAMVGQCFGAGKFERMNESVSVSMKIAVVSTLVLSVLLLAFGKFGLMIISEDQEVIAYAYEMLWYFVPFYISWIFIEILTATLRGKGDSIPPTIICVVGICLLRIVWVFFVFPNWHTVMGISMCYGVSWMVSMVFVLIYYFKIGRYKGVPQGNR